MALALALYNLQLILMPRMPTFAECVVFDNVASQRISAPLVVGQMEQELGEDVRSYALKHDALRRLTNRDEETAWRRALVQVAGERAVSGGTTAASEAS